MNSLKPRRLMFLTALTLAIAPIHALYAAQPESPDSAVAAPSADRASANTLAAFEKLKGLAGAWVGQGENGQEVEYRYEVVADGHTVMGRLFGMVDMFHLDGDSLFYTHYCSANTQPRMRARVQGGDVKELSYQFIDATNLAPGAPHISSLVLRFIDANTLGVKWTYRMNGIDQPAEAITMKRK